MTKTENFICKAKTLHNDKYDYSLVDYINNKTKVKIICFKHGEFEQTPDNHLCGSGCCKCSTEINSNAQRKTTEIFIAEASLIHNNLYDYSLADYINSKTKLKIICKVHGEFEQIPSSHLQGKGCKKCATEISSNNQRKSTEQFVIDANIKHNNKYDYSLVDYKNWTTKVKIICHSHGTFEQNPNSHLNGTGCPQCANLNRNEYYKDTPTQFYIIKYKGLYKVGITTQDVNTRYAKELTDDSKIETLFIKYFSNYKDAYEYEQLIIKLNQKYKYSGEPIFKKTGNTEVFTDLWKESFN